MMPGQDKSRKPEQHEWAPLSPSLSLVDSVEATRLTFNETLKGGLEDLVNVNSLLSIAVFVGLTYATPSQRSLENRPECDAELRHAKNLVVLEVVAFSFFLFSSLVAKSLKVNVQLDDKNFKFYKPGKARLTWWKWVFLSLSVLASFLGCFFLMLSMFYLIQIRLGRLSCKSPYTQGATLLMTAIVCVGMLIYLPLVIAALHKTLHLDLPSPPTTTAAAATPAAATTTITTTTTTTTPPSGECNNKARLAGWATSSTQIVRPSCLCCWKEYCTVCVCVLFVYKNKKECMVALHARV
ncbi:hypothetical protein ACSBR1_033004 [Camellia fascicularis]